MNIVKNLIEGYIKSGYPRKVSQVMRDVGDFEITSMTIYKTPISGAVNKLINILSLGTFDSYKQSKGYDAFMHLYAVVTLSNGQSFLMEKNEIVNVDGRIPKTTDKTETMKVNLKKITLTELLENARQKLGQHKMFVYSGFENNCQAWIRGLLQSSGMLTKELDNFIMQDIDTYAKQHGLLVKVGNAITDVAGALNKAGNAIGLYKNGGFVIVPRQYKKPHLRRFG
jgi:hypothetical protein